MTKKIKTSTIFHFFIIILIALFSQYEIFRMYFFRDDFTLLYHLQQRLPFPYPYMYEVAWFSPAYKIFNLNPFGYFAFGFIFFLVSAFIFYYFTYQLFSKKTLSLISTVIYVTAPIGLESNIKMVLFQPAFFTLIFLLLILVSLEKFYKEGKITYYVLSFALLFLSFEILPFRSFFFPPIIVLFGFIRRRIKIIPFKTFLLVQFIILFIWIAFFLIRPNLSSSPPLRGQNSVVAKTLSNLKTKDIIINPVNSSLVVMYALSNITKAQPIIPVSLFIFTISFSIFFLKKYWKKENNLSQIYLFACLFIYLEVLSFFPTNRSLMTGAKDHYLTFNLPVYSLFIICIYLFLNRLTEKRKNILKILPTALLILLILTNSIRTQEYFQVFNKRIAYVHPFFEKIKQYMPELKPNSLIYFELPTDGAEAGSLLYDIWAVGMYDTNAVFAVLYNLRLDQAKTTIHWKDVMSFAKDNPQNIDRIYGFRYDLNGLHDKIKETKALLSKKISQ